MSRFNFAVILSLFFILAQQIKAQADYVAKVGNNEITKTDFRNRFELSPRVLDNKSDNQDSIKLDFLYSLIAEKLWATEARNENLENSDGFKFYYTPVEKSLIRDQVFQNEIADKVKITDNEISNGMKKYVRTLELHILASGDSSLISNLYSQLRKAGSMDSLIEMIPDLSRTISTKEIKFGDLSNERIENEINKLQINEFTEPIRNGDNWFIFELKSVKPNLPDISQNKLKDKVKNIIKNRRVRNLYEVFYKKYFGGYSIKAREDLFSKLSATFYNVITGELKLHDDSNNSDEYYLSENDIIKVKNILGSDFLQKILFETRYGPVTVYDFLSDLTIVDVKFYTLNRDGVNKVLSNELKRFMQQETVYQFGIKMGIQNSDKLKSRLRDWKANILAQLYKNRFNNQIKINQSEIEHYYYSSVSDSVKINNLNIQTLTVTDLDKVQEILNLIETGKSFNQIENEVNSGHGIKLDTITQIYKLKSFGKASDIIMELKTGEIYGPVKTDSGYTLVQVIEKSNIPDSARAEIDDVKDNIRRRIFMDKLNDLLESRTIELANKYGVIINKNFLQSENYSEVNLFVHQYLGFGGRIAAVPFTTPFYKWYSKWKSESGINP